MSTAVVLLSGGLDSTVSLAITINNGYDVAAMHVMYGQRTQTRELQAFKDVCEFYGVSKRLISDVSHLSSIGGSSLTDSHIPVPQDEDVIQRAGIPITYVPFRNANILSMAVSWAEVIGARAIVIGAVEEDSSGYPDCRRTFFDAFQRVITEGTRPETQIDILTPVISMSKADIVTIGSELNAPLHHTWSCYVDNDTACGTCESCKLRARGFNVACIADPVTETDS